jgi:hypothetical protein
VGKKILHREKAHHRDKTRSFINDDLGVHESAN